MSIWRKVLDLLIHMILVFKLIIFDGSIIRFSLRAAIISCGEGVGAKIWITCTLYVFIWSIQLYFVISIYFMRKNVFFLILSVEIFECLKIHIFRNIEGIPFTFHTRTTYSYSCYRKPSNNKTPSEHSATISYRTPSHHLAAGNRTP